MENGKKKMRETGTRKLELMPEVRTMCYMAAHGAKIEEMAKAFDWTPQRVRSLMTREAIKVETEKIRMQIYGNPVQKIKSILPEAIQVEYEIMTDKGVNPNTRHSVAKTFIEQGLGKPKQNIQLDGGFTIRALFERLDQASALPKSNDSVPIEVESEEIQGLLEPGDDNRDASVDEFIKEFERDLTNAEEPDQNNPFSSPPTNT